MSVSDQAIKKIIFYGSEQRIKENSVVTFIVSVGIATQSGDSVYNLLLALVRESGVKKIIILLTGYLQRHWILLENQFNEEISTAIANNMDYDWLTQNKTIIDDMKETAYCSGIEFEIKFWKEYIVGEHEILFQKYLKEIECFYMERKLKKFYASTYRLVFKSRRYMRYVNLGLPKEKVDQSLLDYVLEECAVEGLRIEIKEANYEVYLGEVNHPIKKIAEYYRSKIPGRQDALLILGFL